MKYRVFLIAVLACLAYEPSAGQEVTSGRRTSKAKLADAPLPVDPAEFAHISLPRKWTTDLAEQAIAIDALKKRGVKQYLPDAAYGEGPFDIFLEFDDMSPTDADMALLRRIPDLRRLDFGKWAKRLGPTDRQLIHLKNLTPLRSLCLNNTRVSDAGLVHLSTLRNLEFLDLSFTPVTYAGLVPLLRSMPKLKWLYIEENWQVTLEQVQDLQRIRPGCQVIR